MKTTHRIAVRTVAAAFALLGAVNCNAVFGFEERTLIPPQLCEEYCAGIMAECQGSSMQYENERVCEESCFAMNSGEPGATSGNNVECRLRYVEEAASLRADGKDVYDVCSQAGYGSSIFDDPPTPACVAPCAQYCARLPVLCAPEFQNAGLNDENCTPTCAGLDVDPDWNPAGPNRDTFDSLQCRLWHLSNAERDPGTHCPHAVGITKCALPLP